MQIGDVYILHNVQFPGLKNQQEDTFIRVVITETRKVPGEYYDEMHDGFKATDENGVEYTNCWERFNEASSAPYNTWFCEKDETFWFSVETNSTIDNPPTKPTKLIEKFPNDLSWCDKHHILFRTADGYGCYGCHLKLKAYVKISAWKGWI